VQCRIVTYYTELTAASAGGSGQRADVLRLAHAAQTMSVLRRILAMSAPTRKCPAPAAAGGPGLLELLAAPEPGWPGG
jgi:hypothetical protein